MHRLVAEISLTAVDIGPEPMPAELSWRGLRRDLLILVVVLAAVAALVLLLPGLGSLRDRFADAQPGWLVLAAALQVGSCLSYVLAFRTVFCRRMDWTTSYQIASSELATNSLLSVGGAGGLALGAWILRRGGMPGDHVARRTVAFFLLTSLANVTALVIGGVGLGTGLLTGSPNRWLGIVPALIGLVGIGLVIGIRPIARRVAHRTRRVRVARWLENLAAGVDEALALLRTREPALIAGAAGYMLFDVAMLGVCFTAFGNDVPAGGVLLMAYLIGQLGGLIPIPGGIGGVDGGLIGTLILYGANSTAAATAVLAYRGLLLVIPLLLGVPALIVLQQRLRQERHDIAACTPGDHVEVIGRGRVPAAELLS
jgi:uncharacterized membrane protein YbhN (UPF0104 family)